jgi:hypothetical protein
MHMRVVTIEKKIDRGLTELDEQIFFLYRERTRTSVAERINGLVGLYFNLYILIL